MPMVASEIERLIKEALPDATVTIEDLRGDGDHYAAHVVSAAFKGKTRVQQHQLVYQALQRPHGKRAACARVADLRTRRLTTPSNKPQQQAKVTRPWPTTK